MVHAHGYWRTDTVHERGECAIRGGIVDLFPGGEEQPLRLDFFGDEIETVRRFDPADQRTSGSVEGFTLLSASGALLAEDAINTLRDHYRAIFGATTTGEPLHH